MGKKERNFKKSNGCRPATVAVHAGEIADPSTGALSPNITMSAAFKLPGFGSRLFDALTMESFDPPFAYVRWGNPTGRALEEKVAALEGGETALALASGMAAVSALLFTMLKSGEHVIAGDVCYAGTQELFGKHIKRFGVEVSLVNTADTELVAREIRKNTKLIYIETPANPLLSLADISVIAGIARKAGIPLAVDSTWAGPCIQKPLELGARFVIHSATKYLNGHGDALGGLIVGPGKEIHRIRKDALVHLGGAMSPFNAWMIARGMVTLPLRMKRHSDTATTLASFLEAHPAVSRVYYPGLPGHPQYELALRQMRMPGGMITMRLKRGLGAAVALAEKIRIFTYATSLGHPRSLLFYYPTDMYVDSVPYLSMEQKKAIREWMGDGLLRISTGLEDVEDLILDLDRALRGRTFKSVVAPAAYAVLKRLGTKS
ncbi:MAG TPA: PLP-dependent aspartate aminotransferase family protein [Spirochaetota bacterium]|nr:PLP-dependent aspartate aminotransferase family protein [Spirochaetota bacterium]